MKKRVWANNSNNSNTSSSFNSFTVSLLDVPFADPKVEIPIEANSLAGACRPCRDKCATKRTDRGWIPEQVAVGVQRELDFVKPRNCGAEVNRSEAPEDQRVWSARWGCFWRKERIE